MGQMEMMGRPLTQEIDRKSLKSHTKLLNMMLMTWSMSLMVLIGSLAIWNLHLAKMLHN